MVLVDPGTGSAYAPPPQPTFQEQAISDLMTGYGLTQEQARLVYQGFADPTDFRQKSPGGTGSGVDHFFDVNPLDQAAFDHRVGQDALDNEFRQTQFQADQAYRDWQKAMAEGDQALAEQKQADYNYWNGISAQIDRERIGVTREGNQQQFEVGMANVAARKEEAQLQYQVGMANATNDAERNAIQERYNQQVGEIARMEDATRRLLGGQQNQTAQFGAETDRAARMGGLALENNKFIADLAGRPADFPTLFLMQRGIVPDFQSLTAGGAQQSMAPLSPSSVLQAYTPTTAAPTFGNVAATPPVASAPAQAQPGITSAAPAERNPWLAGPSPNAVVRNDAPAPTQPVYTPQQTFDLSGDMRNRQLPSPTAPAATGTTWLSPGESTKYVTNNMTSGQVGVRPMDVAPTTRISDTYREQGMTYNPTTQRWEPPAMAAGGYTRAPAAMVGDAPGRNPERGGARPEMILNPTGAPLQVVPNRKSVSESRRPMGRHLDFMRNPGQLRGDKRADMLASMGRNVSPAAGQRPRALPITDLILDMARMNKTQASTGFRPDPQMLQSIAQRYGGGAPVPRFALGTDTSGDYVAQGMASAYIPESSNTYLQGQALPPNLQLMADLGFPIAPAVAAAATGQVAPPLNTAAAATQRGAGVTPSLQTLSRNSRSENEALKGHYQTVSKLPFADLIDFMAKPTQFLRQAQVSRGVS